MSSSNLERYDACPYCLAEIEAKKLGQLLEAEEKLELGNSDSKSSQLDPHSKESFGSSSRVAGCTHQIGYLSKRAAREKIPDECITCEKIVQCMLKAITG